MGVSFVGAGTVTTQATPANATIALPTGTGAESGPEDYMICVWSNRGGSATNFSTPAMPSPWTLLYSQTNTTSNINRIFIFGRRCGESMTAPGLTVTNTGTVTNFSTIVRIFTFGGVDEANPIEVAPTWTNGASAQNSPALTAVSSVNPDAMAVGIAHKADDWTTVAPDGTWVEVADNATTLGTDAGLSVNVKKMPTAASSGTLTVTATGGAANTWLGGIFILKAKTGVTTNEVGFEKGTNGATVVPNSATCPELSINSGTGSGTFSNAFVHRGAMASLINPTAGSQRFKFNNAIPGPIMYVRAYYYITDTTPVAAMRIMEAEDYAGTPIGSIALSTTGVIRVQTSGGSNIVNSSTTMSASTWYRLELCVNVTANTTTARIYTGSKLESVGTDYTDTCQTSVTASVPWAERCLAGCGSTEATNIHIDDFAYSTANWLGPALQIPERYLLVPGVAVGQSSRW